MVTTSSSRSTATVRQNGDIRSWLAGSQASQKQKQKQQRPATPPAPSIETQSAKIPASEVSDIPPSPVPELPSSPPSIAEFRQTLDRDAVIAASSDEDGFASDDSSLPDIFSIGEPRKSKNNATGNSPNAKNTASAAAARRPLHNNPCVTPRAKRTAMAHEFHSSPLTIQAKRHKYDMATLLAFNEKDEATRASAQRFSALLEQDKRERERELEGQSADVKKGGRHNKGGEEDGDDDEEDEEDEGKAARQLKERMLESAVAAASRGEAENDEGSGSGDAGKMRIVRALERADVGRGPRSYYFFEQTEPDNTTSVVGRPFPTASAEGVWAILADKQDRTRHFQSGFPFDIQQQFSNIPDEIFLWVLDEVCSERRKDLAAEYVKLLRICEDQVERLLTPVRLQQLFGNLGATKDIQHLSSPVTLREESTHPYLNRNWSCIENFLQLIGEVSRSFISSTRTTAMQLLLRLGMDSVALENFGLMPMWRWAVDLVARSVPSTEWTNFCQEVCTCLYQSTDRTGLRYRAIANLGPVALQLPNSPVELQRRTLDLKRRLASVFFFDDLKRADKKPEETINIRAIIDRLEEDEFQLNMETDYKELHALMMMLNVALGDASGHRVPTAGLIKDFDAEVDELAESMKSMLTRVAPLNKGIHVSRIEAKNAMELIRERLLYQLRIKPVPKIKMFEMDEVEDDASLLRQQEFMKGLFLKRGKNGAE